MSDKEFIEIVKNSKNMSEAIRVIGIPKTNFIRKAKKLGVYKPNQYNSSTPYYIYERLYEVLTNKVATKTSRVKKYLYKFNLLEDKCKFCGFAEKRNETDMFSVCELHHIDGNNLNNNLTNLCILCPNHHALTKNYRNNSLNIEDDLEKYRCFTKEFEESLLEYLHFKVIENIPLKELNLNRTKKSKVKSTKLINCKEIFCLYCKKSVEINKSRDLNKKYCSVVCANKSKSKLAITKPNKDLLLQDILNMSMLQVGRKYGVSDNAVRKWCKGLNLPSTSKEIKQYKEDNNL